MMKLSVVIPAHNEEEIIEKTLIDLESKLDIEHDVIVVNDHSTDNTCSVVEKLMKSYPNIRLVHNQREGGFVNALKAGFENVESGVIVPVMADLCDDPLTIKVMYKKIIDDGYDVVCGSRYMKGGNKIGGPFLQTFFSRFVGWTIYWLTGIPTHDVSNAFKMYKKEVLDNIEIEEAGFAVSMEIAIKAYYKGYKIIEVPTTWRDRTAGASKFRIFRVAKNYIKWYLWAIFYRGGQNKKR
ncbi:MAG: glycosyltransferase [bacterium]